MLTVGSLFSGIGGMDLGLERAGMHVKWQVEIDEYCQRVLAGHWPDVPRFRDVRSVGAAELGSVDLICGGFPCQDISDAGLRTGITGIHSGLWSDFARIICELRPRYVLVENVTALLGRGMGVVLGDLSALGYDAEWSVISACALGASHTRERVFVLAYAAGIRRQRRGIGAASSGQTFWGLNDATSRYVEIQNEVSAPRRVRRAADGFPRKLDRLRGLGNAVVPQVAQLLGEIIIAFDRSVVPC